MVLRDKLLTDSSKARQKLTQDMNPSVPNRKSVKDFEKIRAVVEDMNFRHKKNYPEHKLESLMINLIEAY